MNLGPRAFRWCLNLYPPFLFSRVRIRSISPDWREVVVNLPKSLLNRNYVGTIFGGALYTAADPFHMLMLIKILGMKEYVVWDKGAQIDYKKPARSKLTYRFIITDDDLARINQEIAEQGKSLPSFEVHGVDQEGEVCVSIKKLVYVRKKNGT